MSTGTISSRDAPAFPLNLSCKRGDEQGAPGLTRSHFFSDSRKETGSELGQVGRGEAPRWVPTPHLEPTAGERGPAFKGAHSGGFGGERGKLKEAQEIQVGDRSRP